MTENWGYFVLGIMVGGGLFGMGAVILMTWFSKDDWLEGYESGLNRGTALIKGEQK